MGHIGRLKDQYRGLVSRLQSGPVAFPEPRDHAARQGWTEILEILYTPEEAELAARMPVKPMSLDRLSVRLGVPAEELARRLDPMCDKGIVMDLVHPKTGMTSYLLSPPIVGFFEFSLMRAEDSIPKKRMAEALHAYTSGDDTFARELFGGATTVGRALVHESGVGDDLPDVLDWQRASAVVGDARAWAVSLCYCRHMARHVGEECGAPRENCLSLNGGAEFVVRRRFGRAIERSEALELLRASREQGLVQIADNVQSRPVFVCNCCGCCCELLRAANTWGVASVNPSGFEPASDPARCTGCSGCARACPLAVVRMQPVRRTATQKNALAPSFDLERCIGCGVCADACRKGALRMARGHRARPVPRNAMERVVRMAIERGRLADLLFDEGAGRGSRFLHKAVEVLAALPLAKQALASEQVKSRFVRAAMGGAKRAP